MFKTLKDAWGIPELRQKLIFTALILLLFRIGSVIPVPFVNPDQLKLYFDYAMNGTIFDMYDMMSGSAFSMATVLALGIQPYINSSIIIQLLTIAIPALERMSKEGGEEGKKKLNLITRCTTVGLGLLMGWAYYMMLSGASDYKIIDNPGFWTGLVVVLTFAAGSTVVMWLGEQITEHGIGNGISMILLVNIISRIPSGFGTIIGMFTAKTWW